MPPTPINALRLTRETLRHLEDHDVLHAQGGGALIAPLWTKTPSCPKPDPIPNPW